MSQCLSYWESFQIFQTRINKLVKDHGWNFAFQYLKLSQQLLIQAINNTPIKGMSSPRVKRDYYGMPTIIPHPIRVVLRDRLHKDWLLVVKATLTVLSIFRTFSTKVEPSLDSITSPFSGESRTLNESALHTVIKRMKIRIKTGRFSPFVSEKAGPNGSKATWTSHLDAWAMIEHPRQLIAFIALSIRHKSVLYALWLIVLIVIMSPFIPIKWLWKSPINMGKLSVVYDQAGKARVVAITNFWIQLALKPLHDAIFKYLSSVEEDGTFDQDNALKRYMANSDPAHKFHSFDLTSATDRIPVDVQEQILNELGYPGKWWKELLDISWKWSLGFKETEFGLSVPISGFKNHIVEILSTLSSPHGTTVKYAVGQPMGAYSSWAMLALTHHVIVRYAAHRAGVTGPFNYVVLGDDISINHDAVAQSYLAVMQTLGVSINMSKSIISNDLVEFAKRWVTREYDLSPLGPGNILVTLREPYFLGTLVSEAERKGFFKDSISLRAVLDSIPSSYFKKKDITVALWAALGLPDVPNHLSPVGVTKSHSSWYVFGSAVDQASRDSAFSLALSELIYAEKINALSVLDKAEDEFDRTWFNKSKIVTKDSSLRLLERWFRFVSPSYWFYSLSFPNDREKALNDIGQFVSCFGNPEHFTPGIILDIRKLRDSDPALNGRSIDWRNRKVVSHNAKFLISLEKLFLSLKVKTDEMAYKRLYGSKGLPGSMSWNNLPPSWSQAPTKATYTKNEDW